MIVTKGEMEIASIKLLKFLISQYKGNDTYTVVILQHQLEKIITKRFYEGYIYYDAIMEDTPVFGLMIDFLVENISMIYTSSYNENNYYHEFTVIRSRLESSINHIKYEDLFQLEECGATILD